MSPRIPLERLPKSLLSRLLAVERTLDGGAIEATTRELIRTRLSQINHCAYCVDMHSGEAMAAGVTAERLLALPVWRETALFSERERAALEWGETIAQLPARAISDALWHATREHFGEEEIVELTAIANAICAWNRLAVACGWVAGRHRASA